MACKLPRIQLLRVINFFRCAGKNSCIVSPDYIRGYKHLIPLGSSSQTDAYYNPGGMIYL